MNKFTEYETAARAYDFATDRDSPLNTLWYVSLGLSGETGELSEHVKKHIRDDNGIMTAHRKELLLREAGDVLWYLTKMAKLLGSSLGEIAQKNIDKLASRAKRGKLSGSGDMR